MCKSTNRFTKNFMNEALCQTVIWTVISNSRLQNSQPVYGLTRFNTSEYCCRFFTVFVGADRCVYTLTCGIQSAMWTGQLQMGIFLEVVHHLGIFHILQNVLLFFKKCSAYYILIKLSTRKLYMQLEKLIVPKYVSTFKLLHSVTSFISSICQFLFFQTSACLCHHLLLDFGSIFIYLFSSFGIIFTVMKPSNKLTAFLRSPLCC